MTTTNDENHRIFVCEVRFSLTLGLPSFFVDDVIPQYGNLSQSFEEVKDS